jgi:translation initiation factor IF-1
MPKEDAIYVPGEILSPLGEAAYRVRLPNGYELVAHVIRRLKDQIGALNPGDPVNLELSPFDLSRGRIISRP